jgi:hypothetical protein
MLLKFPNNSNKKGLKYFCLFKIIEVLDDIC